MSEKIELNNVNPHYLERVVDLSTNYDIIDPAINC